MFYKLFFLFALVPIAEIYLIIQVGQNIGLLYTIGIIVITALLGSYFARSQGFKIIGKIQNGLRQGQIPGREMVEGVLVLIGGVLLLTPGFITDLAGFSLIIPFSRKVYAVWLTKYFQQKVTHVSFQQTPDPAQEDEVIYYEDIADEEKK
ncbi:MAG: FxsA family protein [Spirochaetes bacterium]|nr:FxsA family protein [Spirochaetota bacterium]